MLNFHFINGNFKNTLILKKLLPTIIIQILLFINWKNTEMVAVNTKIAIILAYITLNIVEGIKINGKRIFKTSKYTDFYNKTFKEKIK